MRAERFIPNPAPNGKNGFSIISTPRRFAGKGRSHGGWNAPQRHTKKPQFQTTKACGYLCHLPAQQGPYLQYDQYLSRGYPIATGVIEGACRHLVKDRMEITGAKWRLSGAEAVLRLRALRASNDFEEYWNFHEALEYRRNHQVLYADGVVPPTTNKKPSSRRNYLKVIK
jgi:hypothetical protein